MFDFKLDNQSISLLAGVVGGVLLFAGGVATAAAEVGDSDRYDTTSILGAERIIDSKKDERKRENAKPANNGGRDSKRRGTAQRKPERKTGNGGKARPKQAEATASATVQGIPRATLEAIAACESGGDPTAVNPAGYYGKYQFSIPTWNAVGGTGNPAEASEAEQDLRAAILYNQAGPGQWPVCGV